MGCFVRIRLHAFWPGLLLTIGAVTVGVLLTSFFVPGRSGLPMLWLPVLWCAGIGTCIASVRGAVLADEPILAARSLVWYRIAWMAAVVITVSALIALLGVLGWYGQWVVVLRAAVGLAGMALVSVGLLGQLGLPLPWAYVLIEQTVGLSAGSLGGVDVSWWVWTVADVADQRAWVWCLAWLALGLAVEGAAPRRHAEGVVEL